MTGTGNLILQPIAPSRSVGVGTGSTGDFNLTDAETDRITDGWASITIGRGDGTGAVIVTTVDFVDPVTIQSPAGGGSVSVEGPITVGGGSDATLTLSGDTVATNAAGTIDTTGASGAGAGEITLEANNGLTVDGNITVGGNAPVTLDGDFDNDGTGNLDIAGNGATNVTVLGAASGGGNLTLAGEDVTIGTAGSTSKGFIIGPTINIELDKNDSDDGIFTLHPGSSINALDVLNIGDLAGTNTAQTVIISGNLTAADGLNVAADDSITVNADLTTTMNGEVNLVADRDDSGVGDLTVANNADVTLAAGEGNVTVRGENVTLGDGSGNITTITSGNFKAEVNRGAGGNGDFILADGSSITAALAAGDATVDIDDPFDATVSGTITSDGSIIVRAENDITVTANADIASTSESVTFTSDTDDSGNATIAVALLASGNITGTSVRFNSGTGGNNDVVLNDNINNTSGGINFDNDLDEVNLNTDLFSDGAIDFGANTVNLAGDTVINAAASGADGTNNIDAGSATVVGAGANLDLDAGNGDIFLGTATIGGNLDILDADNLEFTGGGNTGIVSINNEFSDAEALAGLASGNVDGSANEADLTVNSEGGVTMGDVDLSNTATTGGLLTVNVDNGGANTGETLDLSGSTIDVGGISVSGSGNDNFALAALTTRNSTLDVTVSNFATGNFTGSVTSAGGINVNNVTTVTIDTFDGAASADINFDAQGGNVDIFTGITTLNLDNSNSDTQTVTFQTTTAGDSDINLGAIDGDQPTGTDQNLTITARGSVDLRGTVQDVNVLSVEADSNDNQTLTGATPGIRVRSNVTTTGSATLGGAAGQVNEDNLDVDAGADITGGTTLTIRNLATVDLAGGSDLTASGGDLSVATNVGSLNFSGDGSTTNVITAAGGNIDFTGTPITSSSPDTATFNGDDDIILDEVTLGANTQLVVNLDINGGGGTLTVGNIAAGELDVTGTAADDTMTFNGTVNTDISPSGNADGSIDISTSNQVNLSGDLTAATSIQIDTVNTEIDLAVNVDLTASNGDIDLNTTVTLIDLSGAGGTNTITSTDAGNANPLASGT